VKGASLTRNQKKFVDLYAAGVPAVEAYMKAFRSCKSKQAAASGASRLLNSVPAVIEYVDMIERSATKEAIKKAEVSKENILREEGVIAFIDPADLLDENGQLRKLSDMPESIRRAISSIEVNTNAAGETITKIKFWNKGQSLDRLEKCLQMQKDGVDTRSFSLRDIIRMLDGSGRGKLPSEM